MSPPLLPSAFLALPLRSPRDHFALNLSHEIDEDEKAIRIERFAVASPCAVLD